MQQEATKEVNFQKEHTHVHKYTYRGLDKSCFVIVMQKDMNHHLERGGGGEGQNSAPLISYSIDCGYVYHSNVQKSSP